MSRQRNGETNRGASVQKTRAQSSEGRKHWHVLQTLQTLALEDRAGQEGERHGHSRFPGAGAGDRHSLPKVPRLCSSQAESSI